VGVIYRRPRGDIKKVISALESKLMNLGQNHLYYIVGDFNININPADSNIDTEMYLNMLCKSKMMRVAVSKINILIC